MALGETIRCQNNKLGEKKSLCGRSNIGFEEMAGEELSQLACNGSGCGRGTSCPTRDLRRGGNGVVALKVEMGMLFPEDIDIDGLG